MNRPRTPPVQPLSRRRHPVRSNRANREGRSQVPDPALGRIGKDQIHLLARQETRCSPPSNWILTGPCSTRSFQGYKLAFDRYVADNGYTDFASQFACSGELTIAGQTVHAASPLPAEPTTSSRSSTARSDRTQLSQVGIFAGREAVRRCGYFRVQLRRLDIYRRS